VADEQPTSLTVTANAAANVADVYYVVDESQQFGYTINYYLQNEDFESYSLKESLTLTGTTGEEVYAEEKDYPGYYLDYYNESAIASGTIKADGSLVLKLYYNAYPYDVIYDSNNGTGDIYVDEKNPYIYEEEV
ncbi:hypothetical protein, partial [Lutispora sp.]|uniref:hypothetical protein n=1 Tax=Lutispora sp. TaxID=2828727 RepID=UPI00356820C9